MEELSGRIGPYEIEGEIGRGGMGVVYKARDTRLDRSVAIKALPEHFAGDPDRLARFEREARTLASLNHPNVAGIYGVEEDGAARYLIMEFIEGETLADRLDRGPMPLDDALEACAQVAAGLEAAHEAGVIHRDLKPANVRITPDGEVKVLDFGLARVEETSSSGSSVSQMPTMTTPHSPTTPGAILGTAPYMSPEQARGRRVDKRSDIWSFGVLIYECLTGASPFVGETASDSIGAILHKDIDLALLPPTTPRAVRHVIARCLERDRSMRLRDVGDARIEIERALKGESSEEAAETGARKAPVALAVLVSALVFAAAGAGVATLLQKPAPNAVSTPMVRSTIKPPDDAIAVYVGDLAGPVTLSRDGARLCYVAKRAGEQQQIYVRSLDAAVSTPIRGTGGATFPFWSWDGASIGYFAGGELRRYDFATRTNHTIALAPGGRGGAWLADDAIVFAPGFQGGISRVAAAGGTPTQVTTVDESRHTSHRWPRPTRNGDSFVYVGVSHLPGTQDESAIFLSTGPDAPDIEVTRAQYAPEIVGDHMLIVRDGDLSAAPFDDATGALGSEATVLIEGVAGDLTTWLAAFSASSSGTIVFHASSESGFSMETVNGVSSMGQSRRTTLHGRDGRPNNIVADGVPQNRTALSPVSSEIAISAAPTRDSARAGFDIWIYPVPSGQVQQEDFHIAPRRLTFLDGAEVQPTWSPDGQWIYFGHIFTGGDVDVPGLYRVRASGGQPELVLASENSGSDVIIPECFSPDGTHLVFYRGPWIQIDGSDLYALEIATNEIMPIVVHDGGDRDAAISPNGRWLAFDSTRTQESEVYVMPFMPGWEDDRANGLPVPDEDMLIRISIAGGLLPRWNPDGTELFYLSTSNSMIAVNVDASTPEFAFSIGSALFDASAVAGFDFAVNQNWESGVDWFFAINSMMEERPTDISILTNWPAILGNEQ